MVSDAEKAFALSLVFAWMTEKREAAIRSSVRRGPGRFTSRQLKKIKSRIRVQARHIIRTTFCFSTHTGYNKRLRGKTCFSRVVDLLLEVTVGHLGPDPTRDYLTQIKSDYENRDSDSASDEYLEGMSQ